MTMNRLRKWPLKESVDRLCEEDRREPILRPNRTRKGTFIQPSQESVDLSIFSVSRQQLYCSCQEGRIRLLKGQSNKSGYQVSRDRSRSLRPFSSYFLNLPKDLYRLCDCPCRSITWCLRWMSRFARVLACCMRRAPGSVSGLLLLLLCRSLSSFFSSFYALIRSDSTQS